MTSGAAPASPSGCSSSARRSRASIGRKTGRAPLHGQILTRARCVRREGAGIHARRNCAAHELELHAGQDRRENTPLPARWIVRDVLLSAPEHDDSRRPLVAEEPGDARVEPRGDAIQHEDGRGFAATLDGGEHAAAHPAARLEGLQGEPPPGALLPYAPAEPREIETP